ncbi:MAG TPA: cytochrome c biogenesis protein CcdA [Candidatus Binataceae bacterium]|nr:cytochrome c biogenesis protein CcdA [Candidatus Binataceae bacterium]
MTVGASPRRRLTKALTLALVALWLAVAWGSARSLAAGQPNVVTIESTQLSRPLTAGQPSTLYVQASIAPGWHINSDRPREQYYIPTRVSLSGPAEIRTGAVIYPAAEQLSLKFSPGDKLAVFSGRVEFKIPLDVSGNFRLNSASDAVVRIDYQACNDQQCLRPTSVSQRLDIAGIGKSTRTSLAAGPDPSGLSGGQAAIADIFARRGYLLGFLLVLLGGLALNLTPCVYPLIGVTIAYFGYEGGGPRKVVGLAIVYVLGIALMFSAVGVAVALSGGLFGAALQNPYVLGAIAAMLLALAASSFGLFSLQPPQWLMRHAGAARPGFAGALLMGLGMGVVAAPCIGPIVLGLLLMVQRSGSALFGFSLFFTLAIGLGLPYIGLALAAGSIRQLPRSGEWLTWIEQLFGFVLVGLALYFLDPVVPGRLMTRILPYYAIAVGIYLGFVSPVGRNWRPFFVFRSLVGAGSLIALVYLLIGTRMPHTQLTFQPFTSTLLESARSQGKPVVVDFSADWCVPCREMEHTTFADPSVVRQANDFLRLKANLTASNPRNSALMKQFNIEGVPTTVFIDSNGKVRLTRAGYIGPGEFLKYLQMVD